MNVRELLWKDRRRQILTIALACAIVAGFVALVVFEHATSQWSKDRIVELIAKRFQSEVEIEDLQVSLLPVPGAEARKVKLLHKGRRDVPPLVQIERLELSTPLWNLLRYPIHISSVEVEGLLIQIPPREKDRDSDDGDERDTADDEESTPTLAVVDEIVADGTELRILPKESFKEPQVYEMERLRLWRVTNNEAMRFETLMTNAKPPGVINSKGNFGPWRAGEPGDTPVNGDYDFKDADLGVFSGISGILASTGSYEGRLGRLNVEGECDVPDFTVEASGHPVHLKTKYKAVVDGTSGDTLLQPVEASFLDTHFTAKGGVVQKRGIKGKTVELEVDIPEARIEDLLRLAVKTKPMPLNGDAKVKTHFELPPGEDKIHRRLKLKGTFEIGSAKFPDWSIQEKVEGLSNRAGGEPEKAPTGDVVSNLSGDFLMGNGTVTLNGLVFAVPSAKVAMDGDYGVDDESLDFRGTLTMDAKISEATTGFKSFLAKIVDPFFSKDHAGSVIPIKVSGSRSDPKFGLALGGGKRK